MLLVEIYVALPRSDTRVVTNDRTRERMEWASTATR
jgi:hypothetical protein